jgi:hypothetical protein
MHHDTICLLKNKWLASVLILVCTGNAILNLSRLVNRIPAGKHDPLAPLWLAASVLILASVWKLFTCLSEKVTLVLISLLAMVKMLALVRPELIDDSSQRSLAAFIWLVCAGIVGFALLRKNQRVLRSERK